MTIVEKMAKKNWVSAVLSSEMHNLFIGKGLTLSPMENIRCSFKYFEQCISYFVVD